MTRTHFLKRFLGGFLPMTVAALLLSTPALQAQQRIAIIDLKRVFEEYHKTKEADKILEDNAADVRNVLDGWMEEYKKANEAYKKLIESANDQAVSAEERDKRKKEAETKIIEIKEIEKSVSQFRSEAETRIQEQKRRLRDKILAEIREKINERAKTGGYALVLDTSAESFNNQTHVVIFSNGQFDLTTEVLTELNRTAPQTARPAPEAITTAAPPDDKTGTSKAGKAPKK